MCLAGGRWSNAPCCVKPQFIAVKMSSCGSCGLQASVRTKGLIHPNINQLESVYLLTRWPEERGQLLINCSNCDKRVRGFCHLGLSMCVFTLCIRWKGKVCWLTARLDVSPFSSPQTLTSEVIRGHGVVTARSNASWQTDRETLRCGKDWEAWEVKLASCSAAE